MCIICNCGDDWAAIEEAERFLRNFNSALSGMRIAAESMLKLSEQIGDPETKRKYASFHKQLARARKQWAQLEHVREAVPKAPTGIDCSECGAATVQRKVFGFRVDWCTKCGAEFFHFSKQAAAQSVSGE